MVERMLNGFKMKGYTISDLSREKRKIWVSAGRTATDTIYHFLLKKGRSVIGDYHVSAKNLIALKKIIKQIIKKL